jgi:methionine sulfoxide reductase heme-binding subunit
MWLKGWWILGITAIVSIGMLALIGAIEGLTEPGVRMAIRATARVSCLLFLMAFVAAPLYRLWRTDFSQWLLQNRRFLGLSMAVSHGFHAVTIGALHGVTQGKYPQVLPLAVLGYVFLVAMAVTSFPLTTRAIGRRAWRILHTAGMYYFWLAFMMEFVMRALTSWVYFGLTVLVGLAMVIRLWSFRDGGKAVGAIGAKG